MALTARQMRAIELMLEQQERFQPFARHYYLSRMPMDLIVRKFYEETPPEGFEMMILDKIGLLLAPDSTEDLNLVVRI